MIVMIIITELHQQINCLDDALDEIIKHSYEQLSSLSNQTRRVEIDQIISHYNTSKKHLNKTKVCMYNYYMCMYMYNYVHNYTM